MNGFVRAILKQHLRSRRRASGGNGMAIFTDDHIGAKIILDGIYARQELDALARFVFPTLPPGSVCLDIGANIGNHARFFVRHFAQVYAFEPHPRTVLLLRANAMGHNITVLEYGLSDVNADLPAQTNPKNMGGSKIVAGSGDGTTFRVARLDDVLPGLTDARVGFVKLDVEEHEAQAIAGAAMTLTSQSPIVAIEINPNTVRDGSSAAVDALRALGYDHFYQVGNRAFWVGLRPLPLRGLVRFLLRFIAPSLIYRSTMEPVDRLDPQGHEMLVATKGAL